MENPSAERVPDTEVELPEFYEKDKGSAGIHGQNFEYKFCALVFIRAINKGYKFKLASNAKGFGAFDDVVVEYLDATSRKSHIFLQLKSKASKHITMKELLAEKGDFSLRKYYESYIQIEEKFNSSEGGVKIDDERMFIIYTNADVGKELKCNKGTEVGEEEFLMTGGSVLQFMKKQLEAIYKHLKEMLNLTEEQKNTNTGFGQELKCCKGTEVGEEEFLMTDGFVLQFDEVEHKDIFEHLQELPKHREFLSRFRIFYCQADEKEMDCHIKRELKQNMELRQTEIEMDIHDKHELQQSTQLPDTEMELAYMCFRDFIKDWWQNSNFLLKETNCKENDPLRKTSEKVRTTLVANILEQRKCELDKLRIKYKESAITDMKQLIQPHKAVLIFAPSRSTTLTAAKIHQMLRTTTHIILNLQQLVRYKNEVMLAWKNNFSVMVLEGDSFAEDFKDLANEISVILNQSNVEKKFIFISDNLCNIQQVSALRCSLSTMLKEEYVDWRVTDIITESSTLFLEKKVTFQGTEIKINNIVKESDFRMLNALDCDSISLLLGNEKPSIGIPIENTLEFYIDRKLQCRKDVKICSYREENVERETTADWRPTTLLDGDARIILVTDEPGMGKSTLLSHLAKETRERNPDMWIVRVNINSYTNILHEIQTNGFDENGALKLLTQAAQIKETDGVQLEKQLFNYVCNCTGHMVVMIDGVGEVSPHYTEEVIKIMRILYKSRIRKIWVTSRNSVKDQLEQEFQCQSYSLTPFSLEDQKSFLVKFWNQKYPNTKGEYLENLANRVVELSFKHLSVKEKDFMGVPLQSMLLAEVFGENLKQCSTSTTAQLPENLNLVMLYDLYVKKKWDIYLLDKKVSDRTNVNVRTDDDALHDTFIDNHKAAALVAILSTNHIEKLNDKNVLKKGADFLQKINHVMEKKCIITGDIEGRPVFQHRTIAEYFVAWWLCDNIQASQTFMRDHIFESEFLVVRSMVDRILADKCPLHDAVLNSNIRYVARLLKSKQSITQKDRGGRTPLHVAVSCRNPELIRLLLEHGADVSSVDTLLGLSAVQYATIMVDWEMLSLIMEKRPEIREQVLNGINYVHMEHKVSFIRAAAKCGHTDLLRYLVSRENSVNMILPGDNGTLLHEAARGNHIQTVRTLVDLGANCDIKDANGKTALHVSAEAGSFKVAKLIVERQEMSYRKAELKYSVILDRVTARLNRLNVRDNEGNTPLHLAASAGNTKLLDYLLIAGSDFRSSNVRGEYPLTLAARYGRNDSVELLLQRHCVVKCEDILTSALTAAIVAGQVETTALLLRSGSPVSGGENEKPIHAASRLGHMDIISLLLQSGASLNCRTESGNTALHLASEAGHLSVVKYLVERGGDDVNSLNYDNETPLHLAAQKGRQYLVKYILKNGCNVNTISANSSTCLHVACENGHYTTVEYFLKHGATVNAINSSYKTPLHIAASRGKTKIVELLSLHNANFSLRDTEGNTALLAASRKGHQNTLRFIVEHGGNIEDTDAKGNTIAHFAVANENHDILKFLSKQDANLDVQNSDGDTPLLQAVREGKNRIVQYLVEKHSDLNTQGNDGMRPLDVAVLKGNMEITRLLLERNARSYKPGMHIVVAAQFGLLDILQSFVVMGDDINVKTEDGESPLHVACKSGQVATVQYLSEHGALLDLQDNSGNTALHVAVTNGHFDVTAVLEEKGASLNVANTSGSTPLHIAAKRGYLNIVHFLADRFAPIDMQNAKKQTALIVAATEGHEKIVRFLIEQGAGIGVRELEGKTAFDIATEKGFSVITQLLKDRAEGRMLVRSISHTDLHTVGDEGQFEDLQRMPNAGACVNIATEQNNTHTAQMFKIRAKDALALNSNPCSALKSAAENGNLEEVQRLVKAGIPLDYGDTFGRTALWAAASRGHKYIIRYLLENGSCINIADCEGVTPIDVAAREGHCEAVDVFLMNDATIRPESTDILTNQLHKASESGNLEVVRRILKYGASVDFANKDGETSLITARTNGHVEVIRVLLNNGASVDMEDNNGWTPLYAAASGGHIEVVRKLLNHGANVDHANKNGATSSYTASLNGHVEVVRELLNHGAGVDIAKSNGWTPLNVAASKGHVEVLRELLNHGANVDHANKDGATSLYTASLNGHVEVVRELLNHGAGVDIAKNDGWTPLNVAAFEGHMEVVRELLNRGANVDLAKENAATSLYIASDNGHVEVVRELLNHGAGVDIAKNDGWTPLNAAAFEGHMQVVRELLNRGANVDLANKDGATSLYIASLNGHVEVVRELLNHGAGVDIAKSNGWTPLNTAASKSHVEVLRELLNHGANVDFANKDGATSLYIASLNGHVEVVRELLNHGAGVDIVTNNGWTPLKAAASKGHMEVIRELLNRGANVDLANKYDATSLYTASLNGHVEAVRELLNHGAGVDIAKNDGWTPLNAAASKGHMEVVRELLNHGANVDLANKDGATSLYIASLNGHVEVVRELLNHGAGVDIVKNDGSTPLKAAASKGHMEVVRELLNRGANVDLAKENCVTSLYIASDNGHVEVVRELLNHGAGVDIAKNDGWTPLNAAASKGHMEVVRELLNHGANVDLANKDGATSLYIASLNGHVEVVRELLNHGAGVDIVKNDGWTPLNAAAFEGHMEVVRELLNRGANVDLAKENGATSLYIASDNGHVEVVRELLNHGAGVDIAKNDGWTPLNAAAFEDHMEVLRELLNRGANVELANKNGETSLYTASFNGHVEVVRELLNHGAGVDIARNGGWTPLNVAASKGHTEVLRELLNHGANVDLANKDGATSLYIASFYGHVEVVRELLNHGAGVDIATNEGWTPLNVAAFEGHMEVVRELLNRGADVNLARNDGSTPLKAAALKGHVEVVRELQKHGAM